MGRIAVACRAFFAALFNAAIAQELAEVLAGSGASAAASKQQAVTAPKSEPMPQPAAPSRSEAITLLSALQREARFVDFVQESLEGATDEQVGAVVRDVHRECAAVLKRMFAMQPLLNDEEDAAVEVPAGFDSARFRLVGNVEGEPPYQGSLTHHGWVATKCDLPSWSGDRESALVIAPANIEL
jgi:hypothetical protein